LIGLLVSIVLW